MIVIINNDFEYNLHSCHALESVKKYFNASLTYISPTGVGNVFVRAQSYHSLCQVDQVQLGRLYTTQRH